MRTYHVPGGRAEELRSVLRAALAGGEDEPARGRVSRLDDDRLVVVAPPALHAGIEALCRDFESRPAAPAPEPIAVDYWVVRAQNAPDGDGRPLPPELAGAAAELRRDGLAHLSLVEKLELSSTAHEWSRVEGRKARVAQRFARLDDRWVAEFEISMRDGASRVETTVSVEPGSVLVLAAGGDAGASRDDAALYYLVRASRRAEAAGE